MDSNDLKTLANQNIKTILDTLNVEYQVDCTGYICIRCPFHNGNDFNLKFKNDFWYCFSQCRQSYSTIDVIMQLQNYTFKQAVGWLKNLLNIQDDTNVKIDYDTKQELSLMKKMIKKNKPKIEFESVHPYDLNDIENYYHNYILEQGYTIDTLKHFNVGFCFSGKLKDRVCFPIDSPQGDIISVSGRTIFPATSYNPRYKIIGGSKIKSTLYNISRLNNELDYVVVVEGFKDVMYLYQKGYENVVATIGAGASKEQELLLLKLGKKIIVIGDNDDAGKRASMKIYNNLSNYCSCYRIDLSKYTNIEKQSVCDLDNQAWQGLKDELNKVIGV